MWGWLAAGAAALFLLTRKPAAPVGPPPAQTSVDFEAGANRPVTMRVGDALTVNLPPGRTYHVDDFAGAGIIVDFVNNPGNASTGYNSFTVIGKVPGTVRIVTDTRGATSPMTLTIGVA